MESPRFAHHFRYVGGRLFCEGAALESLVDRFGIHLTILELDALDTQETGTDKQRFEFSV